MNEEQARKFAESVELPAPAFTLRLDERCCYRVNKPNINGGDCYTADQVREAIAAALVKAGQKTVLECLQEMPEEQRLDVFSSFCTHCGTNNPRCQCWNDE